MTNEKLTIKLILGSARTPRFGDVIARWVTERIDTFPQLEVEAIDPRELDLPQSHQRDSASAQRLRAGLALADGFIVVTPEYNRSYPGAEGAARFGL